MKRKRVVLVLTLAALPCLSADRGLRSTSVPNLTKTEKSVAPAKSTSESAREKLERQIRDCEERIKLNEPARSLAYFELGFLYATVAGSPKDAAVNFGKVNWQSIKETNDRLRPYPYARGVRAVGDIFFMAGDWYEQNHDWDKAIDLYQSAVEEYGKICDHPVDYGFFENPEIFDGEIRNFKDYCRRQRTKVTLALDRAKGMKIFSQRQTR